MKKNIEWAQKEVDRYLSYEGVGAARNALMLAKSVISQLDEPEVLSQEWIDRNKEPFHHFENNKVDYYVSTDFLQNLLIPKKELPAIPNYMVEYLEFAKKTTSLIKVMKMASVDMEMVSVDSDLITTREFDWISTNDEVFAKAWLDGYVVEEEPLYYAKLKEIQPLEGEWLTNLSGSKYYALDTKGLMLGECLLDLVNMEAEASTHTLKDWERYGINEDNADFLIVEDVEE